MFERRLNLIACRNFMMIGLLATLFGCLPNTYRVAPVPANLTAQSGDSMVTLAWDASIGASGYNIKRSNKSGGPYAQLAVASSVAYTDSSVANGDTYYYVVSSLAPDGESPNSLQVSGFPDVSNPPPTTFGTWTNVTPKDVDLTSTLCSNFGATSVQADPAHPSNLYAQFHCQGIWKSTDYGATWTGPINTGTNAAAVTDCSGGITIPPRNAANVPTMFQSCIRGAGTGFWRSTDGGVNWTQYSVAPGGPRQDYYPPVVDPYDQDHLVMTGHEFDSIVESIDGGQNWTNVQLNNGMLQNGRSGFIFFIDTGDAATTRGTWLWLAEQSGGIVGTWRTTNGGTAWAKVDNNEHPLGAAQIYQPANSRVIYMCGVYSALGWGVLRSSDYGQNWIHVGPAINESVVLGTSKNIYALYGAPVGPGGVIGSNFQVAAQPGTGTWVAPGTPATLTQGAAQISVVNDGVHNIVVGAMWNSGIWRYIEP